MSVFRQVEAYDNDELNYHGRVRVSFGIALMGAAERIEREIPSISWPFLILHGDDDKLCDIRGSKMMHEKAASSDKKLKVGYFECSGLLKDYCSDSEVMHLKKLLKYLNVLPSC